MKRTKQVLIALSLTAGIVAGCTALKAQTPADNTTAEYSSRIGQECTAEFQIVNDRSSSDGILTSVSDKWLVLRHKYDVGTLKGQTFEYWVPREHLTRLTFVTKEK